MGYYIKKALFLMLYLLFTAVIAASILSIKGHGIFRLLLLLANLALFLYISFGITSQDGQKAYKVLLANDKEREYIIKTGEDRPLNLKGEYHIKNGFIIGALMCVPLVVLLIIHAIITNVDPANIGFGNMAGFLYMLVYAFFNIDFAGNIETVLYASYYWSLMAIPVIVVSQGLAYYLGAKKIRMQQEQIRKKHESIYGEKDWE